MKRLLAVLLVLPSVAAQAVDGDARDDVTVDLLRPIDAPDIDLLEARFVPTQSGVELSLRLAGNITDRPPEATNRYLWAIDAQGTGGSLISQADLVVQCTLPTLTCEVTQGEGQFRSILARDDRIQILLDTGMGFPNPIVGAAATRTVDGNITAQDFTPNLQPFQAAPDRSDDAVISDPPRPWWQTPWIWLVAAVVGAGFAVWRNGRR